MTEFCQINGFHLFSYHFFLCFCFGWYVIFNFDRFMFFFFSVLERIVWFGRCFQSETNVQFSYLNIVLNKLISRHIIPSNSSIHLRAHSYKKYILINYYYLIFRLLYYKLFRCLYRGLILSAHSLIELITVRCLITC